MLAAGIALHSSQRSSGHIFPVDLYVDFHHGKEIVVRHDLIRLELGCIFVFYFREMLFCLLTRLFFCNDPGGLAGFGIDEGRRHLSVIHELHGTVAEAAARNGLDRVRGAPVHLNENDDVLPVPAFRVRDPDCREPEHGHPDPEHLAGAEVPMGSHGFGEQLLKFNSLLFGLRTAVLHGTLPSINAMLHQNLNASGFFSPCIPSHAAMHAPQLWHCG